MDKNYIAVMVRKAIHAVLVLILLVSVSCKSKKSGYTYLSLANEATCYQYNSAMGKGRGTKILVVLHDIKFSDKAFEIDSFFVQGKAVIFSVKKINTSKLEIEFNQLINQTEPTADDTINQQQATILFDKNNIQPSWIISHNGTKKYKSNIVNYQFILQ